MEKIKESLIAMTATSSIIEIAQRIDLGCPVLLEWLINARTRVESRTMAFRFAKENHVVGSTDVKLPNISIESMKRVEN